MNESPRSLPVRAIVLISVAIVVEIAGIIVSGLLFSSIGDFPQRSTALTLGTVQVLGLGAASLIVAQRRASVRYAWALQAIAVLFVLTILSVAALGVGSSLGLFLRSLLPLSVPLAIVLFPAGRTSVRMDARLTLPALAAAGVALVALFLVAPVIPEGYVALDCGGNACRNGLAVFDAPGLTVPLTEIYIALRLVAVVSCIGTVAYRLATLRGPRRREFLPFAIVGGIMLCVMAVLALMQAGDVWSAQAVDAIRASVMNPLRMAMPFALVLGLTLGEFSRGRRLERDFSGIRDANSLAAVEARLQEALDDPGLRVHPPGSPVGTATGGATSAPLATVDGRTLGVVTHRQGLPQENPVAYGVAIPAATLALEQIDLAQQVQALERQVTRARAEIATAGEAERLRVEQDLHDGAQARVIMLKAKLDRLATSTEAGSAAQLQLTAVGDDVSALLADVRSLSVRLKPPPHGQLCAALRDHASDIGASVTVRDDGIGPMSEDVETAVWFCVNEALQNALKHGGPDVHVTVKFSRRPGWMVFDVRDDGPGGSMSPHEGRGIIGMRDRLARFDGRLLIGPELDGSGFRVRGEIPLARSVARA